MAEGGEGPLNTDVMHRGVIPTPFKNSMKGEWIYSARYRQVPTFGRDTIRRFSQNASAMKKLAALDFEDLLQVGLREILRPLLTFVCCSARFQSLRGFSLHLMTRWSSTSFFPWRPGILMPNYGSIPNQHLARWRLQRLCLVRLSAGLLEPPAQPSNYQGRKLLEDDERLQLLQRKEKGRRLKVQRMVLGAVLSICARTNYMHWGTTSRPYNYLELQTTILHKWYEIFTVLIVLITKLTLQGDLEHRRVKQFYARTNKLRFTQQISNMNDVNEYYGKSRIEAKEYLIKILQLMKVKPNGI